MYLFHIDILNELSFQAETYISLGQYSKAEELLNRLLKQKGHRPIVPLYQLSQVYLQQDRSWLALKTVRKVLLSFKGNLGRPGGCCGLCQRALVQEADVLQSRGLYKTALKVFTQEIF